MAGGKVYGASNTTVFEKLPCSSEVLESLWQLPSSSPTFQGSSSMVSFENVCGGGGNTDRPFFQALNNKEEASCDEDYDGCFLQPGKKRRLSVDQVQFLERNFEVENKLEPERKVQLAKELGLQPRQVAIWFQNRRARYKTKQLEKDYDSLKASYDKLQADYDELLKEKDKLKEEAVFLKDKLMIREKGKGDLDLDKQQEQEQKPVSAVGSVHEYDQEPQEQEVPNPGTGSGAPMLVCKQEDASSAKSDVLDSDSPHYTDGNQYSNSLVEPADSSNVFEPDQSDFSQDEDDNFSRRFLPQPSLPHYLLKLEEGHYHESPQANSCNFGFPVEDQPFCFWP